MEDIDRRMEELSKAGKIDPAFLQISAKAYGAARDTNMTLEEVCVCVRAPVFCACVCACVARDTNMTLEEVCVCACACVHVRVHVLACAAKDS